MFQDEEKHDEIEEFTRKIKSLNSIAKNLNNVIEKQNNKFTNLNPEFNATYQRLERMMSKLIGTNNRRFRGWLYLSTASLIIIVMLILLFLVF